MQVESLPYLLDGRWIERGEAVQIRSPYDQSLVGETWRASREDLTQAISAAVRSFSGTREMTASDRQRVLLAVAAGIAREREKFARTIALEAGKPIKTAR